MVNAAKIASAVLIAGLALGVLSLGVAPARAANVSYDLYGSLASGWGLTSASETNPGPTLTANVGDTVTITLHSTDGFGHQFLLDLNGNGVADPGEPESSVFTSTTTLTFTVTQAGTFAYLCTIHGSAMTGKFTAQASGTPVGSSGSSVSPVVIAGVIVAVVAVAGVSVIVLRSRD